MRQYMVDELRQEELNRIRNYLELNCEPSGLGGLYWLHIPEAYLSKTQLEHKSCLPFCTAIEIGSSWVKFEMLIRSRKKIRCNCIAFATSKQRQFILEFADRLLITNNIFV
ncbi:MAG: hypothetical protein ACUVQV_05155 [Dissulfurimicrobium sp.]|uniref:hypothetical protein n=1 Tax=Dissulfurimicrobium sp. TaxID=2022436 RepID=UPI00404A4F5C